MKGENYIDATKSLRWSRSMDRINNMSIRQWDTQYDVTGDGKITVQTRIDVDAYGDPMLSTNPDLWIQTPSEYGEKVLLRRAGRSCGSTFPTSCPKDCSRRGVVRVQLLRVRHRATRAWTVPTSRALRTIVCYFDYLGHTQVCDQCNNRGIVQRVHRISASAQFPASGESCRAYDCLNDCNGNGVCDHCRTNSLGYGVASVLRRSSGVRGVGLFDSRVSLESGE